MSAPGTKGCPSGPRGAMGIPGSFDSRWQRVRVCVLTALDNMAHGDWRLAVCHLRIGVLGR